MARQELPLFAAAQSLVPATASPLSVTEILRAAIGIPARNGKLMLRVILVILFPFAFAVLLHYILAGPLMHKVEDDYENSSLDQKDVRALAGLELFFLVGFCILSFCGMLLTIYASASSYIGNHMGLNDLTLRIRLVWKNALIAWLYVSFLTVVYIVSLFVLIKLVGLVSTRDFTYVWSWMVAILGGTFYCYLAASWTLALVISALEGDGLNALRKARKIIRGRDLQGFCLMLILSVMSIPIYLFFYVTAADDDDQLGPFPQFVFGSLATILFCLAKFFFFVVFTVFYCDCKKSIGQRVEMELGTGSELIQLNP
ncbi:hypothetical protein Tsubulata_021616 [Turnera subulata]|uniref:Uncharacterized protein n=1 Tax=Turnera subulata TaxID=218843 RepID=A0A9Q0FWF5_9ROSI|nr:hypothetical protein Tsubulata_021616 [Turnera subulata]